MGAWSAVILGNDTSCEVHDRFLELYDFGIAPEAIANTLLDEQEENLKCDRTNIWLGLALSAWECKVLTKDILDEVKEIVDSGEDIDVCRELEASPAFLKERERVLKSFIAKISMEREKPRAKRKIPVQVSSDYKTGMCLSYKNPDGKYIGIFLTEAEHYRFRGEIKFWFLDFESDGVPSLDMFRDAKLYGLKKLGPEWGQRKYMGNVFSMQYEKADKFAFFLNIPLVFTIIGNLKTPDPEKFTNAFKWSRMDLNNPDNIRRVLENQRRQDVQNHPTSTLSLSRLLDEISGE